MIDMQFFTRRQGYGATALDEEQGRKIRARVVVDAYDFQSHAVGELWDGERWNEVYTLEPSGWWNDCPSYGALDRAKKQDAAAAVAQRVLRGIRLVLA